MQRSNDNRQTLDEASQWFVDFRERKVDPARRAEFMSWLQRSPEHIRAYMEIGGAYARIPGATEVSGEDVERLIAQTRARVTVVPLGDESDTRNVAALRERKIATPRRSVARIRLAAGIVVASVIALLATWLNLTQGQVFASQIAERRSITLEDGSKVELNAHSKVRIAFTETQRNVELLEGQALFAVAKDANRPFVVHSEAAQIRAVGTQFDVRRNRSGTVVTVLEGRVSIRESRSAALAVLDKLQSTQAPSLLLSAGEQAVVTASDVDRKVPNLAAATAWRQGEFEFEETALADVAEEFNRYSRRRLVVESVAVAGLKITGVYSSEDLDSLVRFLRNQPDLLVMETSTEIRIRAR